MGDGMCFSKVKLLLLQIRNQGDPMRDQEIECFAAAAGVEPSQISPWDLLAGRPGGGVVDRHDAVLIGGSGDYSVTRESGWLDASLDLMRDLVRESKPTFASCWGFQAMAKAHDGKVETDLSRAEVGTHQLHLTEAGKKDSLFHALGEQFRGQMGHEDCVVRLPEEAILLASSDIVEHQAYRMGDRPIWCTQFHPELKREQLLVRVLKYPTYIENIAGIPAERFGELLEDAPETEGLMQQFMRVAL